MANTFKLKTKASVGTSLTTVYTVPASTTTVVIGLTVANKTGASVNASAQIVTASTVSGISSAVTGDGVGCLPT